jgi:hypothetical protein
MWPVSLFFIGVGFIFSHVGAQVSPGLKMLSLDSMKQLAQQRLSARSLLPQRTAQPFKTCSSSYFRFGLAEMGDHRAEDIYWMIKANLDFCSSFYTKYVPFTIDSFGAAFETLQDSGQQPDLLHGQRDRYGKCKRRSRNSSKLFKTMEVRLTVPNASLTSS